MKSVRKVECSSCILISCCLKPSWNLTNCYFKSFSLKSLDNLLKIEKKKNFHSAVAILFLDKAPESYGLL